MLFLFYFFCFFGFFFLGFILPFILGSSPGVHKKVANRAQFKTKLLWDSELHFFIGTLGLFEYLLKSAPLNVRKNKAGLLGLLLLRLWAGLVGRRWRFFLFPFTGHWNGNFHWFSDHNKATLESQHAVTSGFYHDSRCGTKFATL